MNERRFSINPEKPLEKYAVTKHHPDNTPAEIKVFVSKNTFQNYKGDDYSVIYKIRKVGERVIVEYSNFSAIRGEKKIGTDYIPEWLKEHIKRKILEKYFTEQYKVDYAVQIEKQKLRIRKKIRRGMVTEKPTKEESQSSERQKPSMTERPLFDDQELKDISK